MNYYPILNAILVFFFGAIFGFAEILQRYRETKYNFKVKYMPLFYIILNGIISVIALLIIKYFRGQDICNIQTLEINNIIIAGFGGMMILRSSIFTIKHNEEKIEVGLATLFQIFLNTVEKSMKNQAAAHRINSIELIMKDVNFDLAKDELTLLCINYIDDFPIEDKNYLIKKIEDLSNLNSISSLNKSLQLGRFIADYCGENILISAIAKLPNIKNKTKNDDTDINSNLENLQTDDDIESRIFKLKNKKL